MPMPYTRHRIMALLKPYVDVADIDSVADRLMVIVHETVADGFDNAAAIFEESPVALLHRLANETRAANNSTEY